MCTKSAHQQLKKLPTFVSSAMTWLQCNKLIGIWDYSGVYSNK